MARQPAASKTPLTIEQLLKIPGRLTRRALQSMRGSETTSKIEEETTSKPSSKAPKKKTKRVKKAKRKPKKKMIAKKSTKVVSKKKRVVKEKEKSRKSLSKPKSKKRTEPKKRSSKLDKSKKIKKKPAKVVKKKKKKKKIKLSLNTQSILSKILGAEKDSPLESLEGTGKSESKKTPSLEKKPYSKEKIEEAEPHEILNKPSVPQLFPGIEKIGKRSMATETLRNFTAEETLTNNHSLWKHLHKGSLMDSRNSVMNGGDINLPGFQFKSAQSHKRLLLGKNGFTLPEQFEPIVQKFRLLDFLLLKFHQLKRQPTLLEINSLLAGLDQGMTFSVEDIKNIVSVFSEFCTIRAIFFGNPISNLGEFPDETPQKKPIVNHNDSYKLNDKPISLFQQVNVQNEDKNRETFKIKNSNKKFIDLDDLVEVQNVPKSTDFPKSTPIKCKSVKKLINHPKTPNKNDSLLRIGDDGFIMDYIIGPMFYSSEEDLVIRDKIFFHRLSEMALAVHDQFLISQGDTNAFNYQFQKSWHFEFDSDLIWRELQIKKTHRFENLEKSREFFRFNVDDVSKRLTQNKQIQKALEFNLAKENHQDWLDSFSDALFDQIFDVPQQTGELERICEEEYDDAPEDFLFDSLHNTPCELDAINQVPDDQDLWIQNPNLPPMQQLPKELTPAGKVPVLSQEIGYAEHITPVKAYDFDSYQNYFGNSDYKNTVSRKSKSSRKEKRIKEKSLFDKNDNELDFLKTDKKSVSVKYSVSKKSEKHSHLISPLINSVNRPKLKNKFSKLKKTNLSSHVKGILNKIIPKKQPEWRLPEFDCPKTPYLKKVDFEKGVNTLEMKTIKRKMSGKDINIFQNNPQSKNFHSVSKVIEQNNKFDLSNEKRRKKDQILNLEPCIEKQQFGADPYYDQPVTVTAFSMSKIALGGPRRKSNQLHPNSMKEEIARYFQKRGFKTVFFSNLVNYLKNIFKNSCHDRLFKLLEEFFSKNFADFKVVDISPEQKLIKPLIPVELV